MQGKCPKPYMICLPPYFSLLCYTLIPNNTRSSQLKNGLLGSSPAHRYWKIVSSQSPLPRFWGHSCCSTLFSYGSQLFFQHMHTSIHHNLRAAECFMKHQQSQISEEFESSSVFRKKLSPKKLSDDESHTAEIKICFSIHILMKDTVRADSLATKIFMHHPLNLVKNYEVCIVTK